ncbi:hypothetical protein LOTGIDRAFT_165586 [Lottia gigantea]|uniref:ShKT domain-containing protein n=1 Tax=Lottia gigantea TaxID=225164 RepID=V3ZBQ4_LOTGI|nr:hypothetical protein LOTGIDRAFT_165586 [Lottia gigantea]ESO88458.1 hypothetical protein LOTGIDRAFT_165586 [Lottia gigantea]
MDWKIFITYVIIAIKGIESSCRFPAFLQTPSHLGETKPWNTETWWINLKHDVRWLQKQDIFIDGNNLWRHREHSMKRCDRVEKRSVYTKTSFGRCSERELVYNRTCLTNEGYNTYKIIQYNLDRTHKFTCMRFIRRSDNLVQVLEGPLSDTNDPDLCDEDGLVLEEWPWVAKWRKQSYKCPISGGFTFRTISRLTNEDHCESEWRRSTLEVECVVGDGLDFMSPVGSDCNPLIRKGHHKRLACWSGWETDRFIYMVAGEFGEQPKYCLRFPKHMKGEFSVLIYFSVICPEEEDGKPPTGIQYYELRMRRKDEDRCEDDDEEQCKMIEAQGICSKEQQEQYTSHCRKTCGLCQHNNAAKQGCYFDAKIHGSWVLYDLNREEDVQIERRHAVFSKFGKFHCREKGTNENQYKTVTTFRNGCVPRYTCFEFSRRNNNLLSYRASRSLRQDKEMEEICAFHDDPFPLLDTYRSYYFKNLILSGIKNLWPSYCGIDSTIPFNGTFNDETCDGTISDWDADTCRTRVSLTLQSTSCPSLLAPLELQCLAFITYQEEDLQEMIITRSMDGRNEFNCWIISSYIIGSRWPWRVLYKMPTTQCTPLSDVESDEMRRPKAALFLEDKEKRKECKPMENPVTLPRDILTRSTNKPHVVRNDQSHSRDNHQRQGQRDEIDLDNPRVVLDEVESASSTLHSTDVFRIVLGVALVTILRCFTR